MPPILSQLRVSRRCAGAGVSERISGRRSGNPTIAGVRKFSKNTIPFEIDFGIISTITGSDTDPASETVRAVFRDVSFPRRDAERYLHRSWTLGRYQ